MPLSDLTIRRAKPQAKPYKLTDERGLYLIVHPSGGRWWRFDYRFAEKRKTLSLGVYPDVSLETAREKRDGARKKVAAGTDPAEERKAEKAKASRPDTTFKTMAYEWWGNAKSGWSDAYAKTIKTRLDKYLIPEFGSKQIDEVSREDVLAALRKIEARGALTAARRARAYADSIFEFSIIELSLDEKNPAQRLVKALKPRRPVKHRAKLSFVEMPQFLARLREDALEEPATLDALRFTLLTWARTTETRFAHRDEFEAMDSEEPLWRIPGPRMKMKKEHLVPLPRQAVPIVRRLIDLAPSSGLLFGRDTRSGTISENTMLYALYRLGYHSRATVHGFRGVASTWANEETRILPTTGEEVRKWDADWVERQLAHVPEDEVRSAYNAALYLGPRRRMLQAWADWLEAQEEVGLLIG